MGGIVVTFSDSALKEAGAVYNKLTGWRRKLGLLRARVWCNVYLLRAMWHGQCELIAYDGKDRVLMVAAVTGSIFNGTLRVHRVFWASEPAK